MLKTRKFMSWLLALCLCMAIALPAFATDKMFNDQYGIDQDIKTTSEIDNIAIINDVTFEKADIDSLEISDSIATVSAFDAQNVANDKAIHYEATFDKGVVDVYTTVKKVEKTDVENYVNMANSAIKQEMAIIAARNEDIPDVIVYQYTEGNIQIACGADTNKARRCTDTDDFFVTEVYIFENVALAEEYRLETDDVLETQTEASGLSDGIGIRQFANQDGQYMTVNFANCPPLNVDKTVNGIANSSYGYYQYIGFSGSNNLETDMGVLYSPTYNGWQPYAKINQNGKKYMIYSNKPGITDVGYVPGGNGLGAEAAYGMTSSITMTAYKNINGYNNGANNGSSTIRLTVKGTRISPLTSNVMCISEAGTGVTSAVRWKALTTIAGSEDIPVASNSSAPRIEMNYTGVKIGTQNATWSTAEDGTAVDRSRITSKGSGYIKGKVNFS